MVFAVHMFIHGLIAYKVIAWFVLIQEPETQHVDQPLAIWLFVPGTLKGSWTSPTSHHGS